MKENCCSKEYNLGLIKIRKGLTINKASIGWRYYKDLQDNHLWNEDMYALIKLLPI